MPLINNNISPLPFYDDITFQNHRKDYAFGAIYPLVTHRNMLLPFQIITEKDISINRVHLYDYNTGNYINLTNIIKQYGLIVKRYEDFAIVIYPGTLPIPDIKHEGLYYLQIIANNFSLYSDIFCVKNNVDDYALLEYSNPYNFELKDGIVDFSDNFKFKCYLPTQIGKPKYAFEEEATERMGYSFVESQVSKKIYNFTFVAPEYLCDALRIVRMCQDKSIISKGRTYDMTTFEMDVDWEEQGDLASVECSFETDTVIANIGGYVPEPLGGDFNKDFNKDFDIS